MNSIPFSSSWFKMIELICEKVGGRNGSDEQNQLIITKKNPHPRIRMGIEVFNLLSI